MGSSTDPYVGFFQEPGDWLQSGYRGEKPHECGHYELWTRRRSSAVVSSGFPDLTVGTISCRRFAASSVPAPQGRDLQVEYTAKIPVRPRRSQMIRVQRVQSEVAGVPQRRPSRRVPRSISSPIRQQASDAGSGTDAA
jgi:hypothetical protein